MSKVQNVAEDYLKRFGWDGVTIYKAKNETDGSISGSLVSC